MTPNAQHKRAERERRKAAGEVRVECWLSADDVKWLTEHGATINDAVRYTVGYYRTDCVT